MCDSVGLLIADLIPGVPYIFFFIFDLGKLVLHYVNQRVGFIENLLALRDSFVKRNERCSEIGLSQRYILAERDGSFCRIRGAID
jgi:hypothetical protein